MKNVILCLPILLITACHAGDPRPANQRSTVSTVANKICILAPVSESEKIRSISISEVGNYQNRMEREFTTDKAPELRSDKCAPNFDFNFIPGKSYISSIQSTYTNGKDRIPSGSNYSVTFSVWIEKGALKAADIN